MPVENYNALPTKVQAIQFLGWTTGVEICEWTDAYYVPKGFEHPARRGREFDSNGNISEEANSFMMVRISLEWTRVDLGNYVVFDGLKHEILKSREFSAKYEKEEDAAE